jgi:hypothetical protein
MPSSALRSDCHAAVLLLSRNAAASPSVLKEATILAWRRSLDPSFQLFPVCLTDVDDGLLEKQKFGYFQIAKNH